MKIRTLRAMALIIFLCVMLPANETQAQGPEYERWGELAMEKMAEEYPAEDVKDYDYQGKVIISYVREQFSFQFLLEDGSKVRAYVLVNRKNNELIGVHLEKV